MAPILVPQYELLSPSRFAEIIPEKIDQMNDLVQQTSAYSDTHTVWSYNLMTVDGRGQYEGDGLHVTDNVARAKADVLLNLRCNPASSKYPFDRTYCDNYAHPNQLQWIMILLGMLLLPILLSLRKVHFSWISHFLPSVTVLTTSTIFCLVIYCSYYADRAQIFEKSHKQFHSRDSGVACFAVSIARLVSIRKIRDSTTRLSKQPFLSRDQSEKWKGWMQFFILIYHYTHGSSILEIYEIVRSLLAAYLFLTGCGHAMYFLKTGNYSLKRLASLLVRLNLLSYVLHYIMQTDYMFYYFSSLISFWFLVIYVTHAIGHRRNCDLSFLSTKIFLSGVFVACFVKVPKILESVLLVLNTSCGISCNMVEWRFRISLGLYIVYVGMIVAAVVIHRSQLKSSSILPISLVDKVIQFSIAHQAKISLIAAILSVWFLACFYTLAQQSSEKEITVGGNLMSHPSGPFLCHSSKLLRHASKVPFCSFRLGWALLS